MTPYDEASDGPNFAPEHGVQLHDPRLLEYVGAPESARLTSRSPEYWIHHMGREKALSAALQLQHDAGLILSNVQVLQQLVTSLNRTSSDVLRAVHGRQPFPTEIFQQVTVQIMFIFIGQTHLVFGKRVCTCVTKHSNAFRTFLNWLKNSKHVWHQPKLHILRLPIFANFDL